MIGPTDTDIRVFTVGFSQELVMILGHHCRFYARTDTDTITVGSWLEPIVICYKKNSYVFHMMSNEDELYIQVVVLDEIDNFVVQTFF